MDEMLTLIAERRRRRLLRGLAAEESLRGEELVDRVTGHGEPPDSVRSRLYHCDLPKLADAGVVVWDTDPLRVRPGEAFPRVAQLMDAIAEAEATPEAPAA